MPKLMQMHMHRWIKSLIASAALAAAGGALAQPAAAPGAGYPNRPVKIIVAFPAGGGTDIAARILAPKLAERWASKW